MHRLITAAHFEFTKVGVASIHNVSNFLKACGLDPFVGCSYTTHQRILKKMDKELIRFGKSEHNRLAEQMPPKAITLAEDETFHPEICLVAMEAASNTSFWKNTPKIAMGKLGIHQLKTHLLAYPSE